VNQVRPQNVRKAVLLSVAGIVLANILMLWVGGIFGWRIYGHLWPMELVVLGGLLLALMAALPSFWLLIPGGIVLGNGFLFSYFSFTGMWSHWAILWPLEPLLIAVSIIAPFLLKQRGTSGLWLTRRIGQTLLILAWSVFVVSLFIGIITK
jgi:hypothetical protein